MARKNYAKKFKKNRKSKYTKVEQTAYLMGQVERGLKNPDSRITSAFNRGNSVPKQRIKKPLF